MPTPEPDLPPDALVQRAAAMREELRDRQEETEERGTYAPDTHELFQRSGFYRILQPRRFGGYELDVTTFFRVMVEISRGCPSTGWCLCLSSCTSLVVASHWPEQAQVEAFGGGELRSPHHVGPAGWAQPVDGGFVVSGSYDYSSGIPYATHFMGTTLTPGVSEERPTVIVFLVPHGTYEVLDDWRGDMNLGMRGSGSNTVVLKDVFVPRHMVVPFNWYAERYSSPGARIHSNPMYVGRVSGFYHGELAAVVIGAARAALDEYEQIIRSKRSSFPPFEPRYQHPDHQRTYGLALAAIDSAEAILYHTGDLYMSYAEATRREGVRFTMDQDSRLYGMIQQAARLAAGAVEQLFAAAGTSAAKRGQRMQRYLRDVAMYRGHIAAQHLTTAPNLAQVHLGLPASPVTVDLPFPPMHD